MRFGGSGFSFLLNRFFSQRDQNNLKWFWENYKRVVEDYPWVNISGGDYEHIGDIALNNHMGINNCPGEDYQMLDIDPMGYARRCPENPTSYDARIITQLIPLLKEGTPCKKDKCNCIV